MYLSCSMYTPFSIVVETRCLKFPAGAVSSAYLRNQSMRAGLSPFNTPPWFHHMFGEHLQARFVPGHGLHAGWYSCANNFSENSRIKCWSDHGGASFSSRRRESSAQVYYRPTRKRRTGQGWSGCPGRCPLCGWEQGFRHKSSLISHYKNPCVLLKNLHFYVEESSCPYHTNRLVTGAIFRRPVAWKHRLRVSAVGTFRKEHPETLRHFVA